MEEPGRVRQLEIVRVDPDDPRFAELLAAWHATYAAAERDGREGASPWRRAELRAALESEERRRWLGLFLGRLEGEAVVAGTLELPMLDNTDHARVAVHTLPGQRRRGLGSAMLAHLEVLAREHRRTILDAESAWSYDAPADGAGTSGADFATRHGFAFGLGDVQRRLDLPVDEALLDRLAREAAPHHAAYTLRSWVGPVPDELVQGWVELSATLMTEAPTGDLDVEPEAAEVAALREQEALIERQGRTKLNAVALDADGSVVAYTDLVCLPAGPSEEDEPVSERGRAYQWGTLVRRDHRGHRLGLAVKVATLRLLQRERPDVSHVVTWNAEVNAHMVGVNEALGFRPVERLGEFQKRLG
ncbi:GNAT family N-acetyltransferase [Nocardioides pacificus]